MAAARVKLYSRPGNDLRIVFLWSSRRWPACARAPASSTGRRLPVMTAASPYSIAFATTCGARQSSLTRGKTLSPIV